MRGAVKRAVEALCAAQKILLTSHVNPDGDAIGCVLALTHALQSMGKSCVPLLTDGVPDIYAWLPGADAICTDTDQRDFDISVVCDAGALDRVGKSQLATVACAPILMNIDHHVSEQPFGDIRIIDSAAAATAELIYSVIRMLGVASGRDLMTRDIADCLMTGIITDTGSFRYMNVTPRTFYLAARLQRMGSAPAPIAELVFENRSFASLKLLGRALANLDTTEDGLVAWTTVSAADFAQLGASDADSEGIVNHVRAVRGTQIGVLFREISGKNIRISLRAREGTDVNRVAAVFGGGGHRLAAGCSIETPLADAVRAVIAECERQLREQGEAHR